MGFARQLKSFVSMERLDQSCKSVARLQPSRHVTLVKSKQSRNDKDPAVWACHIQGPCVRGGRRSRWRHCAAYFKQWSVAANSRRALTSWRCAAQDMRENGSSRSRRAHKMRFDYIHPSLHSRPCFSSVRFLKPQFPSVPCTKTIQNSRSEANGDSFWLGLVSDSASRYSAAPFQNLVNCVKMASSAIKQAAFEGIERRLKTVATGVEVFSCRIRIE